MIQSSRILYISKRMSVPIFQINRLKNYWINFMQVLQNHFMAPHSTPKTCFLAIFLLFYKMRSRFFYRTNQENN